MRAVQDNKEISALALNKESQGKELHVDNHNPLIAKWVCNAAVSKQKFQEIRRKYPPSI